MTNDGRNCAMPMRRMRWMQSVRFDVRRKFRMVGQRPRRLGPPYKTTCSTIIASAKKSIDPNLVPLDYDPKPDRTWQSSDFTEGSRHDVVHEFP